MVLSVLAVVVVLLITEWMPLEVMALLVLGVLALTGLVSPIEALAGFSNPAVVTIWAVFILSGGLTRTGIANILGRYLLKIAGNRPTRLVIVIMVIAGALSSFMNNIAVAALMLPVVMDVARKTRHSPSLLLMPLAYGTLLGGLTTMIGTPPNILVSEALRTNGLEPFRIFDFSPIGLPVMIIGTLFVALVGTRLLPRGGNAVSPDNIANNRILTQYRLQDRLFRIKIPEHSALIGKSLADSHLGSSLGLNVIGISRGRITNLAPEMTTIIMAGDELIVEGRFDRIQEMNNWGQLLSETRVAEKSSLLDYDMQVAEVRLDPDGECIGKTIAELGFRNRYGLNVLSIKRQNREIIANVKTVALQDEDILVVCGPIGRIHELSEAAGVPPPAVLQEAEIRSRFALGRKMRLFSVPYGSKLLGQTVSESCLGDALDVQIVSIVREDGTAMIPSSDMHFEPGDTMIISGLSDMIAVLLMRGLEGVFVKDEESWEDVAILDNEKVGLMEVVLSPYSIHLGQTLQDLRFREKYGLTVLAVWRKGKATRSGLRDLRLQLGDALLLFGNWKRLALLGQEPDFLVLTQNMQEAAREDKAKIALAIMAAVLLPVILGLVPIYIAVVIGAAMMVLSKCLTMDEAYRYIEWKAVFLIAGMLPLGQALEKSGAATLMAEAVITTLGPYGPHAVLCGMIVITFVATSIIPTAALVVLMTPIALKTSAGLGISPYPLMMGIAMAASSSFTSPISHPANVLVMGPGGYRFIDYVKVGGPLTLLILVVLMVIIPTIWPLSP
ncbi:SLC13 family permease [Desulfoprunum benzoelyticum]|uniref:Di/tricarboxylate transporter n=2 Tax=Desulfoprunum benzoelyticum TaxID=1506996 RepID=A0A840V4I4_9BACT|nr:di/tricarboxylate transporter [Desulfoprunum benzoelyticum]MBM9531851.1 SLC13 family permease [Desulfoprunum benzoelyticum]